MHSITSFCNLFNVTTIPLHLSYIQVDFGAGLPQTPLQAQSLEHGIGIFEQLQLVTHCPLSNGLHPHVLRGFRAREITGFSVY